jgi:urease accessory protein
MSIRPSVRISLASVAFLAAAGPAVAHPGDAPVYGFAAGFLHPLGGIDHVLAMVAVGLLAALLGGRALWLVPASFLGAMLAGGALGWFGLALPSIEYGIIASVIVLGAVVALARRFPAALAMALAATFAVFHGQAHAAEMPLAASALSYSVGFVSATALLHGAGIGLGVMAERVVQGAGRAAFRIGGGTIAALGIALLLV